MPRRGPDDMEAAILDRLGPVAGLDVLDAGCGAGGLTLELVARGATVTALDLAPRMVALARARMERDFPAARARFATRPVEDTGLEDASVDRVVGKWILHHADLPRATRELARVLRPGGFAVFFENQAANPLLALARRHLLGRAGIRPLGTEHEHPLTEDDFARIARDFGRLERDYPNFYFFELFSRSVLRYRLYRPLRGLDRLVWRRLPGLRRYSYHVLLSADRR